MSKELKWISVADRLPENYQKVIILYGDNDNKKSYTDFSIFVEGIFQSTAPNEEFFEPSIISWMPLPEPPKE